MRKRISVRVLVTLAVLGLLVVFAVNQTYSYVTCSPSERKAIASVPHHDGREIAPRPNAQMGSCQVIYSVRADRGDVADFYGVRLEEGGWERSESYRKKSGPPGGKNFRSESDRYYPYGLRDGMVYEVSVYEVEGERGGSSVSIHVHELSN